MYKILAPTISIACSYRILPISGHHSFQGTWLFPSFVVSLTEPCGFGQICIMLCADHGPCVSGAHNTIVTARAGKDLVSSLVSGKLQLCSVI